MECSDSDNYGVMLRMMMMRRRRKKKKTLEHFVGWGCRAAGDVSCDVSGRPETQPSVERK